MPSLLRQRSQVRQVEAPSESFGSPSTLQFASAAAPTPSVPVRQLQFSSQRSSADWGFDAESRDRRWRQTIVVLVGLALLATPWIRFGFVRWQLANMQKELAELQTEQRKVQSTLKLQIETLKAVKADGESKKKENEVILGKLKAHGDNFEDFDSESYTEAEETENAYLRRIDELEEEVQLSSERKLSRAGYKLLGSAERLHVEIKLTKTVGENLGDSMIMELGPVNLMPHAIDLFLMLVEEKHFFDNMTLMHRNAGSRVIQAVPTHSETLEVVTHDFLKPNHLVPVRGSEKSSTEIQKKEDDYMLHHLQLTEHALDFPVEKYSVLFADHGPHFYINMDDARNPEDATESCFGKIVEGQNILDFMARHPAGIMSSSNMAGIEYVKVLKPEDETRADPKIQYKQHVFNATSKGL